MVESLDAGVGRVLAALDRRRIARNTLVVFTSDNGGERLSRNLPLFSRKGTLWEGGIRVPYLIRWPGRIPARSRSALPAMTMDVTATFLAAAGVSPPASRQLDGIDLLPILTKRATVPGRPLFWRIDRNERRQKAVRFGRWKYLRDGAFDLLYDMAKDRGEREDVAHLYPEIMADLKRRLAAWETEMNAEMPSRMVK
jgi:arylsulfatase A-like enzyme